MPLNSYIPDPKTSRINNLANDLFLLMANLSQTESHDRAILLFINAINGLFHNVQFHFDDGNKLQENLPYFEICTRNKSYGRVIIDNSGESMDQEGLNLLQNSIQMLAVILERLGQKEMLRNEKKLLHELVKDKTKEIEKNKETFRALAENSPDIIFRFNKEHQCLYANNNFDLLPGTSQGNTAGKTCWELGLPEKLCMKIEEGLKKLFFGGKPVSSLIKHPDKELYFELRLVPEFKNNKIISALGLARDVTEIKKIQDKLLQAKEKAEISERLKTAFLSNISHEIRTPLNGIMGFSRLLGKTELSYDKKLNYINIIETNIRHLVQTLSNIIEVSRLDTGDDFVVAGPVKMNDMIESLYQQFLYEKKLINKDQIKLLRKVPDPGATLQTDEHKLRQVYVNLLENAFKFTFEGYVEFGYQIKKDEIIFVVKDTGTGIKKSNLEHVFEKFFKETISEHNSYGGMGLGLTISKKIVEKMGGKIWIQSIVNKGTTVYFSLPLF